VLRVGLADHRRDFRFRLAVDLRDEVVAALGRHVEAAYAIHVADDEVSGAAGGAHGDVEQWMLHGRFR